MTRTILALALLALLPLGACDLLQLPGAMRLDAQSARDAASHEAGWDVPEHVCAEGMGQSRVDKGKVEQWCVVGKHMHGTYVQWHNNGQKAAQGEYAQGKKEGMWIWWHDNSKTAVKGSFENDKHAGTWTWQYPNGTVQEQGDYLNGRKSGQWSLSHDNGKMKRQGNYVNGQKTGTWVDYDKEGVEESASDWVRGQELE